MWSVIMTRRRVKATTEKIDRSKRWEGFGFVRIKWQLEAASSRGDMIVIWVVWGDKQNVISETNKCGKKFRDLLFQCFSEEPIASVTVSASRCVWTKQSSACLNDLEVSRRLAKRWNKCENNTKLEEESYDRPQ